MESDKIFGTESSLCEDIIFAEILPRLIPVKSLLKFKCVSKSWCSYISSEKFAITHLQKSVRSTPLAHHNVIIMSLFKKQCILSHCPVGSLFSESSIDVVQFELDYPMSTHSIDVVGCCNGLCCMLIEGRQFILWNPSTRKSHKLPPVFEKSYVWIKFDGFGYDESNDDYKVLAVLKFTSYCDVNDVYVFRLYSLKTNSWKTVDDFLVLYDILGTGPFDRKGVLVNGKLHWAMRSGDCPNTGLKIVSFNLGSEAGGLVEQPSFVDGNRIYPTMGALEGCLCFLCDTQNDCTEIWVMKEYGVKESWCRVVTVPSLVMSRVFPYDVFPLMCISEEGEVLVAKRSFLLIYNPKNNSLRHLQINNSLKLHQFGFYIQSLVSPFP